MNKCVPACLIALSLWYGGHAAVGSAADIKVLSAAGASTGLRAVAPGFERASGHRLVFKFVAGPLVKTEIHKDGPFEVAISQPETIDALIAESVVLRDTRIDLIRTRLGIAAKAGSAKQDITDPEGFKRLLLAARTLGYAKDGSSATTLMTVLDRMQIRNLMEPKLVPLEPSQLLASVTTGQAEIALSTLPSIAASPELMLVTALPPELDMPVTFTAGVVIEGRQQEAAQLFLRYLTEADAAKMFRAAGYDPIGR